MIYLDAGATSYRKPKSVARAVQWALEHCANPGRGGYRAGLYRARATRRGGAAAHPARAALPPAGYPGTAGDLGSGA